MIYAIENYPQDSRVRLITDDKSQTLSSRMGTGGGNVPMVMLQEESTSETRGGARLGDDGNIRHLEYL